MNETNNKTTITASVRENETDQEGEFQAFFPGIPDLFGYGDTEINAMRDLFTAWNTYKVELFLKMRAAYVSWSWRDWLEDVFGDLLVEGEDFNSKRPKGESGWESQLQEDLQTAGITVDDLMNYLFGKKCLNCGNSYLAKNKQPDTFVKGENHE